MLQLSLTSSGFRGHNSYDTIYLSIPCLSLHWNSHLRREQAQELPHPHCFPAPLRGQLPHLVASLEAATV
jgi:hypothetical protein